MTKEDLFHDYKLICQLKVPFKTKVGMLTYLFSNQPNPWRVTGITENALIRFKENGFKNKSRIGIQRSHINDRYKTFEEMTTIDFKDCNEWWDFFYEKDKTILATSSENKKGNYSRIFEIDESLNLFMSSGYGWKQNRKEQIFLERLYLSLGVSQTML